MRLRIFAIFLTMLFVPVANLHVIPLTITMGEPGTKYISRKYRPILTHLTSADPRQGAFLLCHGLSS
jgi:hypothetical protein